MNKIINIIRTEPAMILQVLNMGAAMLFAFGLNLSPQKTAAFIVIITGVLAVITAVTTRPIAVPVLAGVATSVLTACAAFGLDWSQARIGTLVAFLTVIMSLALRQHLSPAPILAKKPVVSAVATPAAGPVRRRRGFPGL